PVMPAAYHASAGSDSDFESISDSDVLSEAKRPKRRGAAAMSPKRGRGGGSGGRGLTASPRQPVRPSPSAAASSSKSSKSSSKPDSVDNSPARPNLLAGGLFQKRVGAAASNSDSDFLSDGPAAPPADMAKPPP